MGTAVAKRRWSVRLGLLALAVLACGVGWALRPPALPGTLGAVATQVRVGMRQDEAVELIRVSGTDNVDCFFSRGATRDGQEFLGLFGNAFDKLPPAAEIAWAELEVDDNDGRDLVVVLGPGGVVRGTRLNSGGTRLTWRRAAERWRYAIWYRAGR